MIYHIATENDWVGFSSSSHYFPSAFIKEKFIHCCYASQIEGVFSRYYNETTEYILLCIDDKTIADTVVLEKAPNGDIFPHIYAALPKSSIVKAYLGQQSSILSFVKDVENKEI